MKEWRGGWRKRQRGKGEMEKWIKRWWREARRKVERNNEGIYEERMNER